MTKTFSFGSRAAWTIFISAFVVRGLHLLALQDTFQYQHLLEDSLSLDHYAWKLASGKLAQEPVLITLSPVYLGFLGLVYSVFGHATAAPRLIQILLGSFSCVLLYKTAKIFWNERAGWWAGLIGAFSALFIFYDAEIFKPSLVNFVLAVIFYLFARLSQKSSIPLWIAAGIAYGMLLMLRMNALLTVPFVLFWILYHFYPKENRRSFLYVILFCAVMTVTWHGWKLWYMQAATNQKALFKETGIIFYIGNHAGAQGTYKRVQGVRASARGHAMDAKKIADKALGKNTSEKEMNSYWIRRAMKFINGQPRLWLGIEFQKLRLLLGDYEVPNSENFNYTRRESWVLSLPLLTFGMIGPLGLVGIYFIRKREAGPLLLILFTVSYGISLLITYVTSAYRMVWYPPFILFAAVGICGLIDTLRQGPRKQLVAALSVLLFGIVIMNYETHLSPTRYDVRTTKRVEKAGHIVRQVNSRQENPQTDHFLKALKDV